MTELNKEEILGHLFVKGRKTWTQLISKFIDKHKDKCDLDVLFDYTKVIPSSSASKTSIISSNIFKENGSKCILSKINITGKENDPTNVSVYKELIGEDCKDKIYKNSCIVKASYLPEIKDDTPYSLIDNSLEIESQIYKHIVPKIMKHTPYILNSYGSYTCNLVKYDKLNEVMKGAKKKYDSKGKSKSFDIKNVNNNKEMNLLILEKSSGMTLNDFIYKFHYEIDEIKLVIFQLFWTLNVMSRLKIRHNDLHFHNIFVDKLKDNITLYFKMDDKKYVKLTTKYILRIYDFDRSSAIGYTNIDRNITLDNFYCIPAGECNDLYKIYDLWSACCNLSLFEYGKDYNNVENNLLVDPSLMPEISDEFEFVKNIISDILTLDDTWGLSKYGRNFVHLLPKSNNVIRSLLKNNAESILLNKLNDIINIKSNKYFEIVSSIKKGVYCYYLPKEHNIEIDYPITKTDTELYEYPKHIYNQIIKNLYLNNLDTYIDLGMKIVNKYNNYNIDYNSIGYINFKINAGRLLLDYFEYRKPEFLYDKIIGNEFIAVVVACILLSSPVYHKIMNNHSLYKDKVINSFYNTLFEPELLKKVISDIWKTFNNKLPFKLHIL